MQNWGPETKQKGEKDSANTKNGTENAVTTFLTFFKDVVSSKQVPVKNFVDPEN